MTSVKIVDKARNEDIAQAELDNGVIKFEGNYYFEANKVNMANLVVTDRIYVCPYKGNANWVDLQTDEGLLKDVAWIYQDPKPGYGQIKGHVGFYDGSRQGTVAVKDDQPAVQSIH
jgi:uncharacterized protein (DUF427 family)